MKDQADKSQPTGIPPGELSQAERRKQQKALGDEHRYPWTDDKQPAEEETDRRTHVSNDPADKGSGSKH